MKVAQQKINKRNLSKIISSCTKDIHRCNSQENNCLEVTGSSRRKEIPGKDE